jgi:hypothetical protein
VSCRPSLPQGARGILNCRGDGSGHARGDRLRRA